MKIAEIITAYECLAEIVKERIKSDVAFRIGLMSKKLESEYKSYMIKKDELIAQYGEEIEGQKSINQKSPKWADFVKELNLILETDIDIHAYTIKLSLLKDLESVGHHILGIMPLIEDDVTEEKTV